MTPPVTSDDVRDAYDGVEGRLYELMMGELLHLGGLTSSLELAERAGIAKGSKGVDLCCGNGASMRMLVQLAGVASMIGVELSEKQVERTTARTQRAGFQERIRVVHADACETGLPDGEADFVWSEDAWCYVPDKEKLVAEAVRITRPGGNHRVHGLDARQPVARRLRARVVLRHPPVSWPLGRRSLPEGVGRRRLRDRRNRRYRSVRPQLRALRRHVRSAIRLGRSFDRWRQPFPPRCTQ